MNLEQQRLLHFVGRLFFWRGFAHFRTHTLFAFSWGSSLSFLSWSRNVMQGQTNLQSIPLRFSAPVGCCRGLIDRKVCSRELYYIYGVLNTVDINAYHSLPFYLNIVETESTISWATSNDDSSAIKFLLPAKSNMLSIVSLSPPMTSALRWRNEDIRSRRVDTHHTTVRKLANGEVRTRPDKIDHGLVLPTGLLTRNLTGPRPGILMDLVATLWNTRKIVVFSKKKTFSDFCRKI